MDGGSIQNQLYKRRTTNSTLDTLVKHSSSSKLSSKKLPIKYEAQKGDLAKDTDLGWISLDMIKSRNG